MRQLAPTTSLRAYLLDLVYLNATLSAGDHTALAARVQSELEALRAESSELERAEELEVIAQAFVTVKDISLDSGLIEAGRFVRAHHPNEYAAIFQKPPSDIASAAYSTELRESRTVGARLERLPADDVVRVEFSPRLVAAATALEGAIKDKEEVGRAVGLVRLKLEKRRASINLLRVEIYGELITQTKSKQIADRYFRNASKSNDNAEPQPPTPGAPVVPPVVA